MMMLMSKKYDVLNNIKFKLLFDSRKTTKNGKINIFLYLRV